MRQLHLRRAWKPTECVGFIQQRTFPSSCYSHILTHICVQILGVCAPYVQFEWSFGTYNSLCFGTNLTRAAIFQNVPCWFVVRKKQVTYHPVIFSCLKETDRLRVVMFLFRILRHWCLYADAAIMFSLRSPDLTYQPHTSDMFRERYDARREGILLLLHYHDSVGQPSNFTTE